MKKGFKSLVRAISPFTRKKDPTSEEDDADFTQFQWDLDSTDLKQALKLFYKKYNPEKSYVVNEILIKYEGEEMLLLQQLCERYNLTEEDMQLFLDQAPVGGAGPRLVRRPSMSSVSSNSKTEDAKKPDREAPKEREKEREGRDRSVDTHKLDWDLDGVDMGAALKALYKRHNPTKTPNLAAIQNKTPEEIKLALRQLCKRHGLSQRDMQEFLDGARQHDDDDVDILDQLDVGSVQSRQSQAPPANAIQQRRQSRRPPPPPPAPTSQLSPRQSPQPPTQRAPPPVPAPRASMLDFAPPPPIPPLANGAAADVDQMSETSGLEDPSRNDHESIKRRVVPQYFLPGGKRFTFGPLLDELKEGAALKDIVDAANISPQATPRAAVDAEVESLKAELQEAREQVEELAKGSQELAQALKESQAAVNKERRRETMQAQQLELFRSQQKVDSLQGIIGTLREEAKEASSHYDALMDQYQAKCVELETHDKKISTLQASMKKLQTDKADLLQLINILASAPMAAKNVLESYFAKLAATAPRDTFLQENVLRAKTSLMGDRVDSLLQWKRSQEATGGTQVGDVEMDVDFDPLGSDDERDLPNEDEDVHPARTARRNSEDEEEEQEIVEASLKKLSPAERRILENLRVRKADPVKAPAPAQALPIGGSQRAPSPQVVRQQASSSRQSASSLGSSFLARGKELPSVTSSEIDDEDLRNSGGDALEEQYELAKQYLEHQRSQFKISEQLARTNLALQEEKNGRTLKEARSARPSPARARPSSAEAGEGDGEEVQESAGATKLQKLVQAAKPTRKAADAPSNLASASVGPGGLAVPVSSAADWVECKDPRSQRRYWFNSKLKKSTWMRPAELDEDSSPPSRAVSPMSERLLRTVSADMPVTVSLRDPSPMGPARSWGGSSQSPSQTSPTRSAAAASTASSRAMSASNTSPRRALPDQPAPGAGASTWVTAVDPRSQRRYWYNRETKVSTWRKPVDLL